MCVLGVDLCARVARGRWGTRCSLSLHRIPLSQGLSPNLDPGWHPSVSKGPPVLSHYHGVGKEPHPTSYMDAGDLNSDPQACIAMFLGTEQVSNQGSGNNREDLTFWSGCLTETGKPKAAVKKLQN